MDGTGQCVLQRKVDERVGAPCNGDGAHCKAAGLKRDEKRQKLTETPTAQNLLPGWRSGRSLGFGENEHRTLSGENKKRKPSLSSNVLQ